MISQQTIQQITSRIDIIDVIGEFVKLKKRGTNYLGLCPFHGEKSPSFTVSPAKEIYKCFGCGRSGNTITFLMEHEKQTYVEALRWLANRYNVEIEETQVSDEVRQQLLSADSLYIVNSFAQKFFAKQLFETEEGKDIALTYLTERGFTEETIQKFQVGYNPQARNEFAKAAAQSQFNSETLLKSGLVVTRNDELADNYRGRIIFPIHNNSGKILGFGARVIGKIDKAPKYINTPENEIYVKSKILYGLYFARLAIDKADECLLVEGYTDVVSLSQAGVENVVASGGTSLTADQLRLIKKYTNNLTIIYDGDAAGIKAALRGLDMALEEGLNVKLVLIPDKEDPDSYVRLVGANAFKDFVAANKKDFVLFQLEVMLKEAGTDITKKNETVNHIAETLSKINKAEDFSKQQEYIRECASLLKIDEGGLTNLVNKFIREKITKDEKKITSREVGFLESLDAQKNESAFDNAINLLLEDEYQEREVVKRLIEYGNQILSENKYISDAIFEVLEEYHLNNKQLEKVTESYQQMLRSNGFIDTKTFLYSSDTEMNAFVAGLLNFPYEVHDWSRRMDGYIVKLDKDLSTVIVSALNMYKLRKIKRMYLELEDELMKEKEVEKYNGLIKIYTSLKTIEREITNEMKTVYLK
ncbi:MAG TPA: DNA primase [Panacibacter sp.]|nr:DNA primase [Panacibacter sp.]